MKNVKFDFSGQVVVITGSATGLGKEAALQFAKAGADIAICDINEEEGKKTAAECQALGVKSNFYFMNTTDEEVVAKAKDAILKDFKTVDILINNAGVTVARGKMGPPMSNMDIAEWRRVVDINLVGTVIVTKAFGDILKEKKSGKIVNTSSQAAYAPGRAMPHYNASKIAVISYTQSCSIEFGAYNVNVNAVCPGFIYTPIYHGAATDMMKALPQLFANCKTEEDVVKVLASGTALGRPQRPEDIAYGMMFLASDIASEITGQALIIDSGGIRR